jgi:hypothetical protein
MKKASVADGPANQAALQTARLGGMKLSVNQIF